MKSKKIKILGLLSLCTQISFAQDLSQDLGQMPYKHAQKCEITLDTRGFDVFPNKDCNILFLAPPGIEKPLNDIYLEASVGMCDGNNDLLDALNIIAKQVKDLNLQLSQAIENQDDKKIEKLSILAKDAEARLIDSQKKYAEFSSIPASTVQSLFKNDLDGYDIDKFYKQNLYVFLNEKEAPKIATLTPENSVYSFVHYRPENASKEARSILSTTIPGLEILVQPTAQQVNVAHVKANEQVSGETRLSLMSTCPMVQKTNSGWIKKKGALRNVMTVNRNYEIPMKVGYGIEARLNSKVASQVLADLVAFTSNHGLSKTQIYDKMLSVSGQEVFTVKIDTDIALDAEEKEALEHDIRKRLVDRFLAYFETRGDLADLRPVEVTTPEGGMVPVQYVGTKCWSHSGFFGIGGSSGCRDYIYTVQEWREGMTQAQIHDYLSVDLEIVEKKQINDVVQVPMSTVFFEKEN